MLRRRTPGPRPGWFRFYNRVPNDPKIHALDNDTFRFWVLVLCVASQYDGKLPSLSDLAFHLRIDESKTSMLIQTLIEKRLLDQFEGNLVPHKWSEYQYESDSSTQRVQRFRERRRNAVGNVSETAPDTEADPNTETDSEQSRAADAALVSGSQDDWPENFRDQFWKKYPHKIGRIRALELLAQTRKSGVTWSDLIQGLDAYIRSKPKDREWCNPATWLSEGRWDDRPAKPKRSRSLVDAAGDLIAKFEQLDGQSVAVPHTDAHYGPNLLLEHKPR